MSIDSPADNPEAELLVVQEAARLVTRSQDVEAVVQAILRLVSQLLGLNRGRVLLPDAEDGSLCIRYAYGLTDDERERGRYAIGEGITGRVFQTGQIALVQDIDDEAVYLARAVERTTLPSEAVAYIAVPIILDESPIGVLAVHRLRQRPRPFRRDLALLEVIATFVGQSLRLHQIVAERTASLLSENRLLKNRLESHGARFGIIGQSPALLQAIEQALQVAHTATTVLLLGESGTGKERFARMQHVASQRADGPFVSINCAAIPATLIESELFGHEKGAFTGAQGVKRGKIEIASGGTLFLDEIGDLDLELQAKLLRVLEQKMIQRVGGARDIPVDVRIVAATHQHLQEAVNAGRFRLDLFYRLNVFPIRLPPLRERGDDVALLAQHFLSTANQEFGRDILFGPGALGELAGYRWPGNIRQLENLIKRAVLMAREGAISQALLRQILTDEGAIHGPADPAVAAAGAPPGAGTAAAPGTLPGAPPGGAGGTLPGTGTMTHADERYPSPPTAGFTDGVRPYARVQADDGERILAALRHHQGNKTRAAISLGLTPRQLRYRLQKLGLDPG